MRLLFIADGRSPIARNWIRYFITNGSEVHLISTFDCAMLSGLESLHFVPVAFSGLGRKRRKRTGGTDNGLHVGNGMGRTGAFTSSKTIGLRTFIRHWLGPTTVNRSARQVRGSLGSHTAYFFEPYNDEPQTVGLLREDLFPVDRMSSQIRNANAAGLQVTVHAIGDRANSMLLDMFEEAESAAGSQPHRLRIEHAQHSCSPRPRSATAIPR